MSEREEWVNLIRNEYDPAPAHYRMGDDWDDGAGRIADAIMADKTLLLRKQADEKADIRNLIKAAVDEYDAWTASDDHDAMRALHGIMGRLRSGALLAEMDNISDSVPSPAVERAAAYFWQKADEYDSAAPSVTSRDSR